MNVFNSGAYSKGNSFLVHPIPRYCIKSIMLVSLFQLCFFLFIFNRESPGTQQNVIISLILVVMDPNLIFHLDLLMIIFWKPNRKKKPSNMGRK